MYKQNMSNVKYVPPSTKKRTDGPSSFSFHLLFETKLMTRFVSMTKIPHPAQILVRNTQKIDIVPDEMGFKIVYHRHKIGQADIQTYRYTLN